MIGSFVKHLESKGRSAGTIKAYVAAVEDMLAYVGKPESEIKLMDLEAWQASMEGQASATIAQRTAAVRMYFKFLARNELIQNNPALYFEAPTVKHKEKVPLEAEQVRAMIKAATNRRNKAIIMALAQTGMRISELMGLTLDQYRHRIDNTIIICGKGHKERKVTFADETVQMIDEYIARGRKGNAPWLFLSTHGTQMRRDDNSNMLKVCARKAGIENWQDLNICNHLMRATCFTMQLRNGTPLETIQKMAGHSNIQTTLIYAKIAQSEVQKAQAQVLF